MRLWIKLALKEIRNNFHFSLFFIINLTLGLIGFIALDSFKTSIHHHLEQNSKNILTADISVRSNQPFTEQEIDLFTEAIGAEAETSEQIHFISMVAGNQNSRMVRIIGIDENYPLYGDIVLKNHGVLEGKKVRDSLLLRKGAWVAQDLMLAFEFQEGEAVKVGQISFEIVDAILEDPTSTAAFLAGIPTVYLGINQIPHTGLVQTGSRIHYERFYKLPEGAALESVEEELRQRLNALYPGSRRIRIETHKDASEQLGRVLGYLNDYLGLVALIALFLAGVGGAYLFRSFLTSRFREMAILISLGATRKNAYLMSLTQITILGLISAVASTFFAFLLLPILPTLLQNFLPKGFVSFMGWSTLLLAFFMGTLGSVICCLPILVRIYNLNPVALFHENVIPTREDRRRLVRKIFSYMPALLAYWALAVWQAHSWLIGSLFVSLFLGSLVVLGLVAWGVLTICGNLSHHQRVTPKIALRNLNRNKLGAISCFLAIGLGSLLINLIPQIQRGLQEEISQPAEVEVPSFFLFDIQSEQVPLLQNYLQQENFQLSYLSPMIRARLEAVNQKTFDSTVEQVMMTRENEREQRFRNRGFNLSYRAELNDSESYVAGKPLSPQFQPDSENPPEISLEEGFAERLALKIGDELTFDVQSVPITGKVVNLRKVKWNSFQPNFFIVFQPGVLEDAPKIFLAGISNVSANRKLSLQNGIVQRFPNISVIDVSRVVSRILDITEQISWAIRVMAYLSILVGLVVLFSIARYEIQHRFWEINLLKVLGARFQDLRFIVQIEFGILGLFAAIFGVILSNGMSFVISYIIFERLWSFSWQMTLFSIVGISLLCIGTALLATHQLLKQKPLKLLQAT